MANPAQELRRKEEKKRQQKNKEQRIKERDEKVVQNKTVEVVQEEIVTLKKRLGIYNKEDKDKESITNHGDRQKLERLEKELKLVQNEAERKQKLQQEEASKSHPYFQQQVERMKQKPLTELDDPRKSVYWDERMNPYGAPPPGKPRLYHQRGGGVTMDPRYAIVPGQEHIPPPQHHRQPPPHHPNQRPNGRARHPQNGHNNNNHDRNRGSDRPPQQKEQSYNQPQRNSAPAPSNNRNGNQNATTNTLTTAKTEPKQQVVPPPEPKKDEPLVAPSLPAPSQAVRRARRTNKTANADLTSDIWATSEEVHYEKKVHDVNLESEGMAKIAAATKKKKKKKQRPQLAFYYLDMAQQEQGPYDKAQMQAWFQAGFFPESTMVKTTRDETYRNIGDVQSLRIAPKKVDNGNSRETSVQDRIAAMKGKEMSVQDRIAAMKQDRQPKNEDPVADNSMESRIAALRAGKSPPKENMPASDEQEEATVPLPPMPQPGPAVEEGDYGAAYPVDEMAMPPPPPPAPMPAVEGSGGQYGDEELYYPVEDMIPAPPPPPPSAPGEGGGAYDMAVGAYPMDAAYPVADENAAYPTDMEYPATDAYPVVDDYPATDSYPVTDAYPTEEGDLDPSFTNQHYATDAQEPHKKKIKVDKDLVAFRPSHLRKKNGVKKATAKKPAAKKPPKSDLEQQNVDEFLQDIDNL